MEDLSRISIFLVSPQIPENIGLSSRFMKNMGFKNLVLVNPPCLDKAYKSAKKAKDVLEKARIYSSLDKAISSYNLVLATTRRRRKDYIIYDLKTVLPVVLSSAKKLSVAVLFGREDFGLSREELRKADIVFRIPSSSEFPSLNLAYAVGLFCYEIFCLSREIFSLPVLEYASRREVEKFYEYLEVVLEKIGYERDKASPSHIISSLRRIFKRTYFTKREIELLKSIFIKILTHL